jgi:hypothetical protein
MTVEQFSFKRTNYMLAVAAAAQVSVDAVTIENVTGVPVAGRRILSDSIRVDTSIVAANATEADAISSLRVSDETLTYWGQVYELPVYKVSGITSVPASPAITATLTPTPTPTPTPSPTPTPTPRPSECLSCAVGTYSAVTGASACVACEPGKYADEPGAARCGDRLVFSTAGEPDDAFSCRLQCAFGFFQFMGLASQPCTPWSTPVCGGGEFLRSGSHDRDAACVRCRTCEGQRVRANCTAYADAECAECGAPRPHGRWEGNCVPACEAGYVENARTAECELCAPGARCAPGSRTPSPRLNCTHCVPCETPPRNAVWSTQDDRFDCMWECPPGFDLEPGACVLQPDVFAAPQLQPLTSKTCVPGQTLENFKCVDCFGAVAQAELPLRQFLGATWQWVAGCRWQCLHLLGYNALRAESGDHWVCEAATRRRLILEGADDSWIAEPVAGPVAEQSAGPGAEPSAGRRSMAQPAAERPAPPPPPAAPPRPERRVLAWAVAVFAAVPLLLLKCALLAHCVSACRKR